MGMFVSPEYVHSGLEFRDRVSEVNMELCRLNARDFSVNMVVVEVNMQGVALLEHRP